MFSFIYYDYFYQTNGPNYLL